MSHFSQVSVAPPNPILGVAKEAQSDSSADKVSLSSGVALNYLSFQFFFF